MIDTWDLRDGSDQLLVPPFMKAGVARKPFNLLFAGIYDLFFSKMTRMDHVVATAYEPDVKALFRKKIFGTDKFLISAELVAYLKWLIYTAAFKEKTSIPDHDKFFAVEVASLKDPANSMWRAALCVELERWYAVHRPTNKRRRSGAASVDINQAEVKVYNFAISAELSAVAQSLAAGMNT